MRDNIWLMFSNRVMLWESIAYRGSDQLGLLPLRGTVCPSATRSFQPSPANQLAMSTEFFSTPLTAGDMVLAVAVPKPIFRGIVCLATKAKRVSIYCPVARKQTPCLGPRARTFSHEAAIWDMLRFEPDAVMWCQQQPRAVG
jgi:hypothetical protein